MSQTPTQLLKNAQRITSRQNARVVQLAKLGERKHRRAMGCFRFDGIKLASEAVKNGLPLQTLFLKESGAEAVLSRVLGAETVPNPMPEILVLEDSLFDRVSEEEAPEGIISVCGNLPIHASEKQVSDFPMSRRLIFLESIRDPSNLGAIIRSAAAFGVDALILSEDCADIYNAKTVRASMGTLFTQPILRVPDMQEAVLASRQAGRRVFAAALDRDALQLGAFAVQEGDCVVIGNEGHGLSPETVAACDASVFIPMTARAESLNAAVAASILMWTFRPTEGNTPMPRKEIL